MLSLVKETALATRISSVSINCIAKKVEQPALPTPPGLPGLHVKTNILIARIMLGVDIAGIIYMQDGWKRIVKNLATFAGNNKVAMFVINARKLLDWYV